MNLAIIGSAGRREDGLKLNPVLYSEAANKVRDLAEELNAKLLISGGAAFADHIAVRLNLTCCISLLLHLPAPFKDGVFVELESSRSETARVANYYHNKFSNLCALDSLAELSTAIRSGAKIVVTPGFKERNTKVAHDADAMIALTFGNKNRIKDGGTADTCRKYLSFGKKRLINIDLNTLIIYHDAIV